MTSGGTVGHTREKPNRYLSAPCAEAGRMLCLEADVPNAKQVRQRGRRFHVLTYGPLVLCLAIYAAFVVTFLRILKRTVLTWSCSPYWLGSLWYWSSSMPALLQATHRLLFNNVTLFEETTEAKNRRIKSTQQCIPLIAIPAMALPQERFVECKSINSVRLWTRILVNQLTNLPYRLMVLNNADTFQRGFFDLCVAVLRVTTFTIGSTTQGSLIMMTTPFDTLLLVLIVLTTFILGFCGLDIGSRVQMASIERSFVRLRIYLQAIDQAMAFP